MNNIDNFINIIINLVNVIINNREILVNIVVNYIILYIMFFSNKSKIYKTLQYVHFKRSNINKPNYNNKLYCDKSQLKTIFMEDDKGLFADSFIKKGTILFNLNDELSKLINDGLLDTNLLIHDTNIQLYNTFTKLYNDYHDENNIKEKINVRVTSKFSVNEGSSIYCETIKDIKPKEELFRMYGFTTWITNPLIYNLDIITNKTIFGFLYFLKDIIPDLKEIPYEKEVIDIYNFLLDCELLGDNNNNTIKYYLNNIDSKLTKLEQLKILDEKFNHLQKLSYIKFFNY